MDPHIERMVSEFNELKEKMNKLDNFIHSDKFESLDGPRRSLMLRQSSIMEEYCDVLAQRLSIDGVDVK